MLDKILSSLWTLAWVLVGVMVAAWLLARVAALAPW